MTNETHLTLDEVKELRCGYLVWLKYHESTYTPTCPRGYTDCVCDPAYIKFNHPNWYKKLYGDKTPEEASYECQELMKKDPNEEYYCYDNEDK